LGQKTGTIFVRLTTLLNINPLSNYLLLESGENIVITLSL